MDGSRKQYSLLEFAPQSKGQEFNEGKYWTIIFNSTLKLEKSDYYWKISKLFKKYVAILVWFPQNNSISFIKYEEKMEDLKTSPPRVTFFPPRKMGVGNFFVTKWWTWTVLAEDLKKWKSINRRLEALVILFNFLIIKQFRALFKLIQT